MNVLKLQEEVERKKEMRKEEEERERSRFVAPSETFEGRLESKLNRKSSYIDQTSLEVSKL